MSRQIDVPNLPSIDGVEIEEFGRVRQLSGTVAVRELPDNGSRVQQQLRFNDRVFVIMELKRTGWLMVATDDGRVGYVPKVSVFHGAPDPDAKLHYIRPGETALDIAREHYKGFIEKGRDARFYVNVLVYANDKPNRDSGIYKRSPNDSWKTTQTRANYYIWVPSPEFASTLEGKVSAGSIQRDIWNGVVRAFEEGWEWFKFGVGFVGGLIHGALECIWDMVVGLIDLVGMIWDFVRLLFTGQILKKAKELWDSLSLEKIQAAAGKMFEDFLGKWNQKSSLKKGHFRGWVVGYLVATVLLTVFTLGAAALAMAGRLGAVIRWVRSVKVLSKALDKAAAATRTVAGKTKQARDALRESLRKRRKSHGDTPDHREIDDQVRRAVQDDPDAGGGPAPKPVTPARVEEIRGEIMRRATDKERFDYWQTLTDAERAALEKAHRGVALRAKKWDLERRKGDARNADTIKAEEAARSRALDKPADDAWRALDKSGLSPQDRRFLEDPRNRRLAFDVDGNGGFRIDEARTALLAEKQGVLPPPVQRAVGAARTAEKGADIVDGARVAWDVKLAKMGADDIAHTANTGENVLVDARMLRGTERMAMEAEVRRLLKPNRGRVVFVSGG